MGRGLSENQKRILLWAAREKRPSIGAAPWFDALGAGKQKLEAAILNANGGAGLNYFTMSSVMSRALRRLEARELVERIAEGDRKVRTHWVALTPEGRKTLRAIKAKQRGGED